MTLRKDSKVNIDDDGDIGKLLRFLITWKSTRTTFEGRIEQIFIDMLADGFCSKDELDRIRDWLIDLKRIHYVFPAIRSAVRMLFEENSRAYFFFVF